jgi:type VI secretion system protein ImpB
MSQSHPPTLDRARRPRVRITCDAEEDGGVREVELPLVVGVLADLSGRRSDPSPGGEGRHFTPIDRETFSAVLRRVAPRLTLQVSRHEPWYTHRV